MADGLRRLKRFGGVVRFPYLFASAAGPARGKVGSAMDVRPIQAAHDAANRIHGHATLLAVVAEHAKVMDSPGCPAAIRQALDELLLKPAEWAEAIGPAATRFAAVSLQVRPETKGIVRIGGASGPSVHDAALELAMLLKFGIVGVLADGKSKTVRTAGATRQQVAEIMALAGSPSEADMAALRVQLHQETTLALGEAGGTGDAEQYVLVSVARRILGFRSQKELDGFLARHPEVEQDRPKTKDGRPHGRRRIISILQLVRAVSRDDAIMSDPKRRAIMQSRIQKAHLCQEAETQAIKLIQRFGVRQS